MSLFAEIKSRASEYFPLVGGVDLDHPETKRLFAEHYKFYEEWIRSGHHGEMGYLERGLERRGDPRLLLEGAKSIVSFGKPYRPRPPGTPGAKYAAYIQGRDYHLEFKEELTRIMREIGDDSLRWKVCVDSSAVLERTWASLSGLGWIGKNSMLIHPQYGSYLLLAEVILDRAIGRGPEPLSNYCGNCTRCLDGCPTGAFESPGVLNARRCISYWTLEHRGVLDLSESQRKKMGSWVAGCDICQEVCPFNTKAYTQTEVSDHPTDFKILELESEEEYRKRVKQSALNRVKPAQFKRNLAIARRNSSERMDLNPVS